MANHALNVEPAVQPLLFTESVKMLPMAAGNDVVWWQDSNVVVPACFGISVILLIVLCIVVASLVRANRRLTQALAESAGALATIAQAKPVPVPTDLAWSIHKRLNAAYYGELVASIEQSLAIRGYRFGTDRASEIVLSFDVLRGVSETFTRSQVKFMRPSATDEDLDDAVSRDYIDGYSDRFVRTIIDAARELGRYVEVIPGFVAQPRELVEAQ